MPRANSPDNQVEPMHSTARDAEGNRKAAKSKTVTSAGASDPFLSILGIASSGGLPDHFVLLELERGESHVKTIEQAVARQVARTQPFQETDPEGVTTVLRALTEAERCLTNLERRRSYIILLASTPPSQAADDLHAKSRAANRSTTAKEMVEGRDGVRSASNRKAQNKPNDNEKPATTPVTSSESDPTTTANTSAGSTSNRKTSPQPAAVSVAGPAVEPPVAPQKTISSDGSPPKLPHQELASELQPPTSSSSVKSWFREYPIAAWGSTVTLSIGAGVLVTLVVLSQVTPPLADATPEDDSTEPVVTNPQDLPAEEPSQPPLETDPAPSETDQPPGGQSPPPVDPPVEETDPAPPSEPPPPTAPIPPGGEEVTPDPPNPPETFPPEPSPTEPSPTVPSTPTGPWVLEREIDWQGSGRSDPGKVLSLAISADGRWIISGHQNRNVVTWNTTTWELERKYFKHNKGDGKCVAISPDGSIFAVGHKKSIIISRNSDKNRVVHTLRGESENNSSNGHSDDVKTLSFSPDGQFIVSGSADGTLKVWDVESGELVRTLEGHTDDIESLAISPDGQLIASGSRDRTIRIWNFETGDLRHTLEEHSRAVKGVVFFPNGRKIASVGQNGAIAIWNAETGELEANSSPPQEAPPADRPRDDQDTQGPKTLCFAISPDGLWFVTGNSNSQLTLWNATTGIATQIIQEDSDEVSCVTFSPDGSQIISGAGRSIKIWHVPSAAGEAPEESQLQ